RLYQTVSVSDFLGAFQVFAFAFPFPASPTLSDPFGPDFLGAFKFRAFRAFLFSDSDFIRRCGPDLPATVSESSGGGLLRIDVSIAWRSSQILTAAAGRVQF
ncbi:hypothetical protein, partial [Streptomyces sp. NPDC048508]|uniref:hypothetical protein n=1 Tax=Streptomyces sp. NPDC048508 TaxID=3365561 RepID=UPI00371E130F